MITRVRRTLPDGVGKVFEMYRHNTTRHDSMHTSRIGGAAESDPMPMRLARETAKHSLLMHEIGAQPQCKR